MTIVFISNYFNHHQKELCDSIYKQTEGKFCFIETSKMREERKTLGYGIEKPGYVIKYSEKDERKSFCKNALIDADIVIFGSAPWKMLRKRIKAGKLIFKYSERPIKEKSGNLKNSLRFIKWNLQFPVNKPIYLLCASAYAYGDYRKFGMFKNRAYKWGYFPETKFYDADTLMNGKDRRKILWCGRLIDWKHPEIIIELAEKLKADHYDFSIDCIGSGEMEQALQKKAKENDLENNVFFLGSMKPAQVREHMEKAGIYLFTSDFHEGWGAVLNESMNSGCAVAASHEIGAVPFLVNDGENGIVYESCDNKMLYEKVRDLLENSEKQEYLGRNAYGSITEKWNAEIAAQRLIELAEQIFAGEKDPDIFKDGPCSKAEIMNESWFKNENKNS